jgi:hypothetical protein
MPAAAFDLAYRCQCRRSLAPNHLLVDGGWWTVRVLRWNHELRGGSPLPAVTTTEMTPSPSLRQCGTRPVRLGA